MSLCRGRPVEVDEKRPFRGIVPEDYGAGRCCPRDGDDFLCEMKAGSQHGDLIFTDTTFYVGGKKRKAAFTSEIMVNQGMKSAGRRLARLVVRCAGPDGFELVAEPAGVCEAHPRDARSVCKHQGTYRFVDGLAVRLG